VGPKKIEMVKEFIGEKDNNVFRGGIPKGIPPLNLWRY
jgi:hypothetical protein